MIIQFIHTINSIDNYRAQTQSATIYIRATLLVLQHLASKGPGVDDDDERICFNVE